MFLFGRRWVVMLTLALAALPQLRAATSTTTAPTEEELVSFGKWFEVTFNRENRLEVGKRYDWKTSVQTIGGVSDIDAEILKDIARADDLVAKKFVTEMADYGSSRFVRVLQSADQPLVLIRFMAKDGTATYIGYYCSRSAQGEMVWQDTLDYSEGTRASESARRALIPFLSETDPGRLTPKEIVLAQVLPQIASVVELFESGWPGQALDRLNRLPAEAQKDKFVLLLRLQVAQRVALEEFDRALEALEAAFPSEPTLDYALVRAYWSRRNFPATLRKIDAFRKLVGNDPYLHLLAATIHRAAENMPAAVKSARAALDGDPELVDAYVVLLAETVQAKDHAATAALLREIEIKHPKLEGVEEIVEDPDFRKSKPYTEWLTQRASKSDPLKGKP